ncbi:hypothetical protein QBC34DRAFT_112392 [Podospora aff. communis PSN243]|uniref:BTB domain-containing protein n=1 Tax=Podospora aff. communis PSN243 TaxID=3040156 RepID=A0AAV9GKB5_9PEZI|nr:hypothetical protein QBC34DRAFT_112392 [Podospora aff. communis PSN243]
MRPELDFVKITTSRGLTFLIGPNKEPHMLHSGLLAQLCPSLRALVESPNKFLAVVEWPDVDQETFRKFCEWAYEGKYEPPAAGKPGDDPKPLKYAAGAFSLSLFSRNHDLNLPNPTCRVCMAQIGWDDSINECANCRKGIVCVSVCHLCGQRDLTYCSACVEGPILPRRLRLTRDFLENRDVVGGVSKVKGLGKQNYGADYTQVLLCHAKVYVLGMNKEIEDLEDLAFRKLHRALGEYILYPTLPESRKPVLDLIRYVFENTGAGDSLRQLLARYSAIVWEELDGCEDWEILSNDVPQFSIALLQELRRRA